MPTSTRCPECGAEVREDTARWCGSCGAPRATTPADRSTGSTAGIAVGDADATGHDRGRWLAVAIVLVVLGALLGAQVLRRPPAPTLGHTERGDQARTGRVASEDVAEPAGTDWSVPLDLPLPITRPALVGLGDDEVAVLGEAGLTVHERADGSVRWHRSGPRPAATDGPPWSGPAPVVVGDVVVAASITGEVRAYDRASGRERWSTRWRHVTALAAVDGAVLVVDLGRQMTLLEVGTGRMRWQTDTLRRLDMSARAVVDASPDRPLLLHLTSPAGVDPFSQAPDVVGEYVVAFDVAHGQPTWQVELPRETLSLQPFGVAGSELVGVGPEQVHRWDRATGTPIGEVPHGGVDLATAIAATSDGGVLLDRWTTIERFDLDDGAFPAWTAEGWSARPGQPAVAAGEVVHVPTDDGVEVRSAATGDRLTTVPSTAEQVAVSRAHDDGHAAAWVGGDLVLLGPGGDIAWRVAAMLPAVPAPTVRDAIYVSTAAAVTAVERDGRTRWTVPMSSGTRPAHPDTVHAVAAHEDAVLVAPPRPLDGPPRGLVALDPQRGVPRWDRSGDRPAATGPMTLAGDLVFMPVGDQIHGYDVATGRRAFAAVAHAPRGPVAVGVERLVAGSPPQAGTPAPQPPGLVAVHRSDRRTAWRRPADVCAAPVALGDHVIAVGRTGLRSYAEESGTERYAIGLADSGCHPPVVGRGVVVAVEDAATLIGARADDGVIQWRAPLDAPVAAAPTIAGATVLVPTVDGAVVGLDVEDGSTRWRVRLEAVPASSVTVADGAPLLLTRDGRLVRLTD